MVKSINIKLPSLGAVTAFGGSANGSGVVRYASNLIIRHLYTLRSDRIEKGREINSS